MFPKKIVIKKTGERQEYNRKKLEESMRISCRKRPIPEKKFQESLKRIEESIENISMGEIPSERIGTLVMQELKALDKVAFIRFASVYREFKDIGDFQSHILDLKNR